MLPDAPPPDSSIIDTLLYQLVSHAFAPETATEMPPELVEPEIEASQDIEVTEVSPCIETLVVGPDPQIVLSVRGGDALAIEAQQVGEAQAFWR